MFFSPRREWYAGKKKDQATWALILFSFKNLTVFYMTERDGQAPMRLYTVSSKKLSVNAITCPPYSE